MADANPKNTLFIKDKNFSVGFLINKLSSIDDRLSHTKLKHTYLIDI